MKLVRLCLLIACMFPATCLGQFGVTVESETRAVKTVDYAHHEIHGGSAYTCHYENACTNTNEMTIIAFTTADTTAWCHCVAAMSSTALAEAAIYETTSLDAGEGTDLTVFNRNRNSANTSGVRTIESPAEANKATSFNEAQAANANLTTTTCLDLNYIGSGVRNNASGGSARGTVEFILKQNTEYAFVVKSLTDDDNYHGITLSWYEHTNY